MPIGESPGSSRLNYYASSQDAAVMLEQLGEQNREY